MSAPDMPPVSNEPTRFDIKIVVDPSRSPDERRAVLDGRDLHRRDETVEALMRNARSMASFRSVAVLENTVTRALAEHARLRDLESQLGFHASHRAFQEMCHLVRTRQSCDTAHAMVRPLHPQPTFQPDSWLPVQPAVAEESSLDVLEEIRDMLADALSQHPTDTVSPAPPAPEVPVTVSPAPPEVPVRGWKSILMAAGVQGDPNEIRKYSKFLRKCMRKDADAPIWYDGRTPCALPSKLRPWLVKVLRKPKDGPSPSSSAEAKSPLSSSAEAAIKADALINKIVSVRRRGNRAEPNPGSTEEPPEGT